METISNAAQAAAKAVWGTTESKEEPVSGKTGNTSQGEPYDAGNMEPRTTTGVTGSDAVKPTDFGTSGVGGDNYTTSSESDKYTGTTSGTAIPPLEDNYDPAGGSAKSTSGNNETSTTSGSTGVQSNRYTETTDNTAIPPLEDNYDPAGGSAKSSSATTTDTPARETHDDVNTSGRDKTSSSAGPHKQLGSSTEPGKDMSKAQQDVRDPSDPQTNPDEAAKKSNVDDSGDGVDKGDNPDKIDGPGPRPIEQVAKEFGGDAGNAKPEGGKGGKDEAAEEDDGDGPQKTSHGEGTGEKYVKSSGLKADGGDFDATKPGAGKEADRLLETKGVHREVPADKTATVDDDATDAAAGADTKEKKSLGEKIKEKLHKPHFKH